MTEPSRTEGGSQEAGQVEPPFETRSREMLDSWLAAHDWKDLAAAAKLEETLPLEAVALAIYSVRVLRGAGEISTSAALAERFVDSAVGASQQTWSELVTQAQRNADRYRVKLAGVRGRAAGLAQRFNDLATQGRIHGEFVELVAALHEMALDADEVPGLLAAQQQR